MKKNVCSIFLLSIVMIWFFSCSNDTASSIAEGKLAFSVASEAKNSTFQPLNCIPADVAAKMDATELSVWKKLSGYFYIDYSIIGTSYYKENKASFLRNIEKLYEEARFKHKSPQRLLVAFPNADLDAKLSLLENDDSTSTGPDIGLGSDSTYIEDTPINEKASVCERILYPFVSANVYLCVSADIAMTGTVESTTYEVYNQRVFTDPSSAHFSGYAELTPAQQGVNLDAKGRLTYRSMFANVDEHYYIMIIPKTNS